VKAESTPIRSFIKDYHLEKPGGIICFTASVHFHSKTQWLKFVSQVHVITIPYKHLDIIYLLNPDIEAKKIKTVFTNNSRFKYSGTKQFAIKGKSRLNGYYIIDIIPINNNCAFNTINELRSKLHN